jgi:hypothetical protein
MRVLVSVLAVVLAACSGGPPAAPAATPTPFVAPTLAPTDPPLLGTGVVTFGVAYDPDTLQITKPKSMFKTTVKEISFSAFLIEPAGATSLTVVIAAKRKSGVETIAYREEIPVSNPSADTLANAADLALAVDRKAGTYVMRFLRDAVVLAQGEFTLVKP